MWVHQFFARRDSVVWTLLFISGLLIFVAGHAPHLVSTDVAESLKDLGAVLGWIAAFLRASPLGPGRTAYIEPPPEIPREEKP